VRIGQSAAAPTFEVIVRPARLADRGGVAAGSAQASIVPPDGAPGSTDGIRRADDHATAG
jgi:hypothetical protein